VGSELRKIMSWTLEDENMASALGGVVDLRDIPASESSWTEPLTDLGRIDIIVSNAGYGLFGAAEEVSDEQIRDQIDSNLIGSDSDYSCRPSGI